MNPTPPRILLLLLSFSSLVAAANFTQCLENLQQNSSAIGGVDSHGRPTTAAQAVGLTYGTCTAQCGSNAESFSWREFAQLFSSWLLPWLALISQLPFGSSNYLDDFVSVVMSVGSPALAAYSLMLTSINARLVYRRAKRIDHENKTSVARALIALQQTPLELTKDQRLLAHIPINDQWRQEILERLNRRNSWSLATGSSVAWVVIAFAFTLVDSFVSLSDTSDGGSEGLAVGTLWLWLLCLTIGWLWVPTFNSGEIGFALRYANLKAAKKAAKRIRQTRKAAGKAVNSAKNKINNRLSKGMHIGRGFRRPDVDTVTEVVEENEKVREEDHKHAGREAYEGAYPLPSLTHNQSTASIQVLQQDHDRLSVSVNPTANQSVVSLAYSTGVHSIAQASLHADNDKLLIHLEESGSLHRDEFRLSATFNYSRAMRYLVLADDVLRAVNKLNRVEKDETWSPIPKSTATPAEEVVFPPGALLSMFNASIFALILQCGITSAAIIIIVFTPTVGLGCRSLGYTIYGGMAIIIMFLTIISTIFVRISETRKDRSQVVKRVTAFVAIALRRICFFLALINATGLLVLSCFQFSNFLTNCYCNASVTSRGTNSYVLVFEQDWVPTMRTSRIVGIVVAAASMSVYMIALWLISALPAEINDV